MTSVAILKQLKKCRVEEEQHGLSSSFSGVICAGSWRLPFAPYSLPWTEGLSLHSEAALGHTALCRVYFFPSKVYCEIALEGFRVLPCLPSLSFLGMHTYVYPFLKPSGRVFGEGVRLFFILFKKQILFSLAVPFLLMTSDRTWLFFQLVLSHAN